MGVWGNNNFDSDSAMNLLCKWINLIISEIRETYLYEKEGIYSGRGDDQIVVNVDILGTLYDHYRLYPDLELSEVEKWKREYLETFDAVSSSYTKSESIDENTIQRRQIVEATFDRLLKVLADIIQEGEF